MAEQVDWGQFRPVDSGEQGVDWKQFKPVESLKRSGLDTAKDLGKEVLNAVGSNMAAVGDFVSPGNEFSATLKDQTQERERSMSPVAQAAKARFRQEMDGADGALGEVGAVAKYVAQNPGMAAAQAVGSFLGPGAVGVAAKAALGARAALGATAGLGAAGAGGDAAGNAYDLVKAAKPEVLAATPEYQELARQGLSHEAIVEELATTAARKGSVVPAIIGGVGGAIGAEKLLLRGAKPGASRLGAAGTGAVVEGAQEAVEEGVTQYSGAKAAQQLDASIDPTKGVAGAAAMGGVLGAGTGGAMGLIRGGQPAPPPPPASPEQQYSDAVGKLEAAVDRLRGGVDPIAVASEIQSSASVDEAIAKAAQAVSATTLTPTELDAAAKIRAIQPSGPVEQDLKKAKAAPSTNMTDVGNAQLQAVLGRQAQGVDPLQEVQQAIQTAPATGPAAVAALEQQAALSRLQTNPTTTQADVQALAARAAEPAPQPVAPPAAPDLAAMSEAETAEGRLQQIAQAERQRAVGQIAQRFAPEVQYSPTATVAQVNQQLKRLGMPALSKEEQSQVLNTVGSAQAFVAPATPSPKATDAFADNAAMESLIPLRPSQGRADGAAAAPFQFTDAKPVAPMALPVERTEGAGLTRTDERMLQAVAKAFGRKVVIFSSDHPSAHDGFVRNDDDRTVYLNARSQVGHMVVLGHEILHQVKAVDPDAYAILAKAVKLREGADTNVAGIRGDMEEVHADLVGNLFKDTNFWLDVFGQMKNERAQGLGEIVASVLEKFRAIVGQITGYNTDAMVEDMAAVRAAAGQAMAQFLDKDIAREDMARDAVDLQREWSAAIDQGGRSPSEDALNKMRRTPAYQAELRARDEGLRDQAARADLADARTRAQLRIKSESQTGEPNGRVVPSEQRGVVSEERPAATFGQARPGATAPVKAWHFSQQARPAVSGQAYGTGLKGSNRDIYLNAEDQRLRSRVYFYVDKGNGIHPESGVGGYAHEVTLNNLYDADQDSLGLKGGNALAFESAVLDNGFDGYIYREHNLSAAAVVLGPKTVPVTYRGQGKAATTAGGGVSVEDRQAVWETQASGPASLIQQQYQRLVDSPSWAKYDVRVRASGSFAYLEVKQRPVDVAGPALLNIGLSTQELGDGGLLSEDTVRKALQDIGVRIQGYDVQTSDSEPTAVVRIDRGLTASEGDSLSSLLQQQAIVQRMDDGSGELFGPMTEEWGPYNPEFFMMPDGSRASQPEQLRASAQRVHPDEMSTRVPGGKTAVAGEHMSDLLTSVFDAGRGQPGWLSAIASRVKTYVNFRPVATANTDEKVLRRMVAHMKDNLLWLHDEVPADIRERSKLWYDGANKIASRMATKYGITQSQAAGMLAALSPQKDWYQNVSLAERVAYAMAERQSFVWSDKMTETADRIYGREAYAEDVEAIRGRSLGELDNEYLQAMWIRTYDQAHSDRSFAIVGPEGDALATATTGSGAPATAAWGSNAEIAKAVAIFNNGSRENIDARLGRKHKVRNFYNNILVPNSPNGHVTIDTHAVAAALLRPLSGSSVEVMDNFGGPSNKPTGLEGTYALYEEAYGQAARERGILPRELQSITWEAVRGLYAARFKGVAANVTAVDAVWNQYKKGRLSLEQAREQSADLAGGIDAPSWYGRNPGVYEEDGAANDAGGVPANGIPAGPAEAMDGGAGGRASGAVPGEIKASSRRTARDENLDPDPAESQVVEAAASGSTPAGLASWLAKNAPSMQHRLIALRAAEQLKKLEDMGVRMKLNVARVGDRVPSSLLGSRGLVAMNMRDGISVDVWLNGSDVTGKVGVSYETALHEIVHAATMPATWLGNRKQSLGTEFGQSVQDLFTVTNAVVSHFNAKAKSDPSTLTPFERQAYNREHNALRSPDEVLAWALTNPDMQEYLESIPYKGSASMWSAFVQAVRKYLGLTPKSDTALSEVLRIGERLLGAPIEELAKAKGAGTVAAQAPGIKPSAKREDIEAGANALAAMPADVRDELRPEDGPGGWPAYLLFEARKLLPKPSDKLKKVTERNTFALNQDFDAVANVDGEHYGINKWEDPDNDPDMDPDDPKAGFVYAYASLNEGQTMPVQTTTADVDELFAEIRRAGIRASEMRVFDDSGRAYTPAQRKAMENVGFAPVELSLRERYNAIADYVKKKAIQGIFDRFAPIAEISKEAYQLARLSAGAAAGSVEVLLKHGKLRLDDSGVLDGDTSGGISDRLFNKLGKESTDFLRWVAANRAERLAAEGRENLFEPADIAAMKSLSEGDLDYDYVFENGPMRGQSTRSRALAWRDAAQTFKSFNDNVLDIAQKSGMMNQAMRDAMEAEFYLPFYRVMEDGDFRGVSSGLVRQQPFRKLKGGTDKLDADLLNNTLMNWAHIIDTSAKNRAAVATLDSLQALGGATPADEATARQMAKSAGIKHHVVWAMRNGAKEFYVVEDPVLMQSLVAIQNFGSQSQIVKALASFKNVLTQGVTMSPGFKIRNLIRDTVSAIAISDDLSTNPLKNLADGYKASDPQTQMYVSALAAGGFIRFGAAFEGRQSDQIRAAARSALVQNEADLIGALRAGWDWYNEVGNRGEELNRAALFKQTRAAGGSLREAAYEARDLMDFSSMGSFETVRFLSSVVPFFNARMQGMYRLGRGAVDNPKRMAVVIGAVALAGLALWAAYKDDEDYQARETWDVNNFWWAKFGDVVIRIPKPFEVGAVGTLIENTGRLVFDEKFNGEMWTKSASKLLTDNLAMSGVPQAFKPILDVYANKDSLTDRPIETDAMRRLSPENRFNSDTTAVAKAISAATMNSLSPVQVDSLIRGYFGWAGATVAASADMLYNATTTGPEKPDADLIKRATFGLASDVDSQRGRYISEIYDKAKEFNQKLADANRLKKDRKFAEYAEFAKENREEITKAKQFTRVQKQLSTVGEQIRAVEQDPTMDGAEKRERIDRLRRRQNDIARDFLERQK